MKTNNETEEPRKRTKFALFEDKRDAKGGWAPGPYHQDCIRCGCLFAGDKRATHCADCVHGKDPKWNGEPWSDVTHLSSLVSVVDCDGETVFEDSRSGVRLLDDDESTKLGRIIQCVNACAGIPDPESFISIVKQLIEALYANGNGKECFPPNPHDGRDESFEWGLLKSAIAKATGQQ